MPETNLSIYDNAKKSVSLLIEIDEVKEHLDKAAAITEYQKRAGDNELAMKSAKYKMYCERQAGILLKDMEMAKGVQMDGKNQDGNFRQSNEITPEDKPKTLSEMGISKDQSSKWQKLADIPDDKYDVILDKQINANIIPNTSKTLLVASSSDENIIERYNHVSAKNNDWYTPSKYIESARSVMGSIDLDPASSNKAQEIVKATIYYTSDDCGLEKEWLLNLWMNPPYSYPEVDYFISKAINSYISSDVIQAIILVNNATDTKWFHLLLDSCAAFCITKGRINFNDSSGEKTLAARNGQFFFYLGTDTIKFELEFAQYGKVICLN